MMEDSVGVQGGAGEGDVRVGSDAAHVAQGHGVTGVPVVGAEDEALGAVEFDGDFVVGQDEERTAEGVERIGGGVVVQATFDRLQRLAGIPDWPAAPDR
ncbi:hypothetical protein [Tepidiphilus olei]|uniref:hypothetical protein n=1 Tax=Tepidiphilus olei TaxID=2502184 RepID=UPI00115EE39A|nr:hypothetical protein [Tepidiphilus olei]